MANKQTVFQLRFISAWPRNIAHWCLLYFLEHAKFLLLPPFQQHFANSSKDHTGKTYGHPGNCKLANTTLATSHCTTSYTTSSVYCPSSQTLPQLLAAPEESHPIAKKLEQKMCHVSGNNSLTNLLRSLWHLGDKGPSLNIKHTLTNEANFVVPQVVNFLIHQWLKLWIFLKICFIPGFLIPL